MKYSLNIRQPKELLAKADEIYLNYSKDIEGLYDIAEKYPGKEIVILTQPDDEIDWVTISGFTEKLNVTMALGRLTGPGVQFCKDHDIDFFWLYPITSYAELRQLIDLGVSQLYVGGELYFDLPWVKELGLPVRILANLCVPDYIPSTDGIKGTYVRPEDVSEYEPYVDTLMFESDTLKKEAVLFQVYAEEQKWNGNLNLLLTNFNFDVDNRVLPTELANTRLTCRQRCMRDGSCHFCTTAVKYARTLDKVKNDWIPGVGFAEE